MNNAQRTTARATDASLALDKAVTNLAAGRLTVPQIVELAKRVIAEVYAEGHHNGYERLRCGDDKPWSVDATGSQKRLFSAITANHRDAAPVNAELLAACMKIAANAFRLPSASATGDYSVNHHLIDDLRSAIARARPTCSAYRCDKPATGGDGLCHAHTHMEEEAMEERQHKQENDRDDE
jgi:hypothetical protein